MTKDDVAYETNRADRNYEAYEKEEARAEKAEAKLKHASKELERIADKLYGRKSVMISSTEYRIVTELRTLAKQLEAKQ